MSMPHVIKQEQLKITNESSHDKFEKKMKFESTRTVLLQVRREQMKERETSREPGCVALYFLI